MRRILYIFLYLNIYTCVIADLHAQELQLEIRAEKDLTSAFKDSLNFIQSFKDFNSLKAEADSLQSRMNRLGYIDAELLTLQKAGDSLFTAEYLLGRKFNYLKVYFGNGDFSKRQLLQLSGIVKDSFFVLPFSESETALRRLNQIQSEKGNAFGRLQLQNIRKKGDTLTATLKREDGSRRLIDSIAIRGYEKFPVSFIRYYAGIKKGMPFDRQLITEQAGILNSLGFVNSLKPPEVLFREESTTVFFYLEKRNNNLFDGILGFATDEESGNIQFNGYLNLELNNNLNFGEQLLINYKADGNEQQNFRTRVRLPYLFKSPVGAELELRIFKRDSTFSTTDQSIKVNYQLNPRTTVYAGYKANESSNLLDDAIAGIAVDDYTGSFFLGGLGYVRNQDDLLWPQKTAVTIDGEFGSRERDSLTEGQTRLFLNAAHIIELNYNNAVFLRNTTGALLSDSYLTNELFRFGGINSIRGFNENSIDASLYSVLNTEYRYRFNQGFYMHSIVDLGYFENKIFDQKERLYSFGIGLGILTKAGVLKFNFANGISEDQDFKFSNTKIHLSLTSRF